MQKLTSVNKFQVLCTLITLIFFSACQKDPNTTTNANQGTMTLEIDGVTQTPTKFNTSNTLISVQQFGQTGRRLDIRANIGSDLLILSTSNWDFQNPPVDGIITKIYETNTDGASGQHKTCVTNQSITYCDGALATYTTNGKNLVSENMSNEPFGMITISQNNTTDKTISGTFDFKVKDFMQSTAQPVHMTGSFSDLPYTVLN